MKRKTIQWINTPVLVEAIIRYQKGVLNKPMRLWIEEILEIDPKKLNSEELSIFYNYKN